jgi:hypothetical protein
MDIRFQSLMVLLRKLEASNTKFQRDMEVIKEIRLAAQERYIRNVMYIDIISEYTQEIYAWYDYEEDCEDWYMDNCNLWDDNYFHILFDDSTLRYIENNIKSSPKSSMNTNFWYSLVLVCYSNDFFWIWRDLHIWIPMINVALWSIIFSWFLSSDISRVEFT